MERFHVAFVGIGAALFIGGLGISIFAKSVIGFMAAKPFEAAASAVPLLTLAFIFNEFRSFFNFGFLVTDNTKIGSLGQYVMVMVITIAYIMLIPRYGLMGAAEAQCMAFLAGFIYSRVLSRRFFDPGIKLGPMIGISAISVVAYVSAAIVLQDQTVAFGLAATLVIYFGAVGLIAAVAVRTIASVDATVLDGLPRPLSAFVRLVRFCHV